MFIWVNQEENFVQIPFPKQWMHRELCNHRKSFIAMFLCVWLILWLIVLMWLRLLIMVIGIRDSTVVTCLKPFSNMILFFLFSFFLVSLWLIIYLKIYKKKKKKSMIKIRNCGPDCSHVSNRGTTEEERERFFFFFVKWNEKGWKIFYTHNIKCLFIMTWCALTCKPHELGKARGDWARTSEEQTHNATHIISRANFLWVCLFILKYVCNEYIYFIL